jgi:hypothetical protein
MAETAKLQYESRQIIGLSGLLVFLAKEAVKELTIGWISAVRSSRQSPRPDEPPQSASRRGDFLRMRNAVKATKAIKDLPHAEERPPVLRSRRERRLEGARLEAREDADAVLAGAPLLISSYARKRESSSGKLFPPVPWIPVSSGVGLVLDGSDTR